MEAEALTLTEVEASALLNQGGCGDSSCSWTVVVAGGSNYCQETKLSRREPGSDREAMGCNRFVNSAIHSVAEPNCYKEDMLYTIFMCLSKIPPVFVNNCITDYFSFHLVVS